MMDRFLTVAAQKHIARPLRYRAATVRERC